MMSFTHRRDVSVLFRLSFLMSPVCEEEKTSLLGWTSACGAEGASSRLLCSCHMLVTCNAAVWPQGWRLLSTQEGKMAFSAFVGIVALLTTLQEDKGKEILTDNGLSLQMPQTRDTECGYKWLWKVTNLHE